MTAVARMTVLHLRTVAPYRTQGLLVFGVIVLIDSRSLVGLIPALALLLAPLVAAQPFLVADKADLQTLYAVLGSGCSMTKVRARRWFRLARLPLADSVAPGWQRAALITGRCCCDVVR